MGLKRKVEACTETMNLAANDLGGLLAEIGARKITATQLGSIGDEFRLKFSRLERAMEEFKRLSTPAPTQREIHPTPLKQLVHANIHTDT